MQCVTLFTVYVIAFLRDLSSFFLDRIIFSFLTSFTITYDLGGVWPPKALGLLLAVLPGTFVIILDSAFIL